MNSDMVNHPNHYDSGGIECIDAIRAQLGPEGFQAYCQGNVVKYLWRWKKKNGLEDLKKAQVYLGWMVQSNEASEESIEESKIPELIAGDLGIVTLEIAREKRRQEIAEQFSNDVKYPPWSKGADTLLQRVVIDGETGEDVATTLVSVAEAETELEAASRSEEFSLLWKERMGFFGFYDEHGDGSHVEFWDCEDETYSEWLAGDGGGE